MLALKQLQLTINPLEKITCCINPAVKHPAENKITFPLQVISLDRTCSSDIYHWRAQTKPRHLLKLSTEKPGSNRNKYSNFN